MPYIWSVDLYAELRAVLTAMDQAGIEYALAGGLAVAVWGAPRATKDIDLLVRPADVDAAVSAIGERGFTLPAAPMTFRDGMRLQRVSKVEGGDILTVDFMLVDASLEGAWQSRVRVDTADGALWVVSRDALIRMKAAAGRPIDAADIEKLREIDR